MKENTPTKQILGESSHPVVKAHFLRESHRSRRFCHRAYTLFTTC